MNSNAYKSINKFIIGFYIIYLVFVGVLSLKDLDVIMTVLLVFLPFQLKDLFISMYEMQVKYENFTTTKIEEEKKSLIFSANFHFSCIVASVILSLLFKQGELLLSIFFSMLLLLPICYLIWKFRHFIK